MAPPRKSVSRGTGETENDPERENRTQARAPNPVSDEDPERNSDDRGGDLADSFMFIRRRNVANFFRLVRGRLDSAIYRARF